MKLTFFMHALILILVSACSTNPGYTSNPPDQQRTRSGEAQRELSTDVKR